MNKNLSREYPNLNPKDFNLRKYLILLLSKWYWLMLTLVIAGGAAYYFNNSVHRQYSLDSLIIFKDQSRQYGRVNDAIENLNLLQNIDQFDLERNMEMMQSHQIVKETLEKLDFEISYYKANKPYDQELYKSSPFQVMAEPTPALYTQPIYIEVISAEKYRVIIDDKQNKKFEGKFGETFSQEGLLFTLTKNHNFSQALSKKDRFYFKAHKIDALTRKYQEKLEVIPVEQESNIIKISTVGGVPEKLNDFLNTLIETYEEYQLEHINKNADISLDFINHQVEKIENRLLAYENELQKIWMSNSKIRNNYLYPNQPTNGIRQAQASSSSSYNELEELESRKSFQERSREDFLYLSEIIGKNQNIDSIAIPMTTEIEAAGISQLIRELSLTQNQLNVSNQNIEPSHPLYKSLNQQLKEQKRTLLIKVNTYIDYMDKTIAKLDQQIAQLEREIPSYPRVERRYRETLSKIEQNENILNLLSDKKIEFELIKASKTSSFDILKEPRLEQAKLEYPNEKFNYFLAFFAGFVVPASLLIMKRSNYSKIEEKFEIKSNTSIPILHALEHNSFKTNLPVFHYPQSSMADGFRNIRTKLIYRLKSYDHKVIMISSMVSGEGKSFVAANLAAALAMAGLNSIIVSADIRKPSLHKIFSIKSKLGLSDYLSNNLNYEDLIQPTMVDNLSILPAGKVNSHAGDLFSENKIRALLDYLSSRFEFIIFDSPPYSMVPEAMVIGDQSHCNIFLIRHDYSPKSIIEALNDIRQEGGLNNMFLVVNNVKAMKGFGFEHYFGYDASYGFGYYNNYYNNSKKTQKIADHAKFQ